MSADRYRGRLARGRKAVIEIDGPSHYAEYDEASRTYTVSEQRYTLNLRIERSLRRQGWGIFRFSNLESLTTPGEAFPRLIAASGLPGTTPYGHHVSADAIFQALDDIPF